MVELEFSCQIKVRGLRSSRSKIDREGPELRYFPVAYATRTALLRGAQH